MIILWESDRWQDAASSYLIHGSMDDVLLIIVNALLSSRALVFLNCLSRFLAVLCCRTAATANHVSPCQKRIRQPSAAGLLPSSNPSWFPGPQFKHCTARGNITILPHFLLRDGSKWLLLWAAQGYQEIQGFSIWNCNVWSSLDWRDRFLIPLVVLLGRHAKEVNPGPKSKWKNHQASTYTSIYTILSRSSI